MDPKAAYQNLIQQIPDFPVFAQPWYLDSVCGTENWEVVILENQNQVIGALPYHLKKKGPFHYITMPPLCKFMGCYLLPEYRGRTECYQELIAQLPKVSSFTQNFHYAIDTAQPFPINGFSPKKFFSYRLQGIQNLSQTRAKLTRYYRNNILKKSPELLSIRHDLGVEAYFAINKKTYDRQNMEVPFSLDLLRRNVQALEQHQSGKIFFAVDAENRVHAAALLVWDQHTAWYHSAGGDPELRKSGAGIFVVWKMICYASEVLGLDHFDFAGSMIPAIEKLWINFGAKRRYYYHLEHHFSPAFSAGLKIKGWLKGN